MMAGRLDLTPGSYRAISLPSTGEARRGIPTAVTEDEAREHIRRGDIAFRAGAPCGAAGGPFLRGTDARVIMPHRVSGNLPVLAAGSA